MNFLLKSIESHFIFVLIFLIILNKCSPIEKYLFDSTIIPNELNWDKEAFGDSAEVPGWKEQSYSQKSGDVWRIHFVCDISSNNPNNWLRLPFIARDQANRLIIKLEYTIRECKKYPGEIRSCKETFQLLYIESDGPGSVSNDEAPEFSESNYKYLKTIAPNSVSSDPIVNGGASSSTYSSSSSSSSTTLSTLFTSSSSSSSSASAPSSNIFKTEVDLPLRTQKKGVYLVFRDQGACVSLLSIKVYYTLCSSQINNLVEYPITPTGSNVTDLVQQPGRCIQNSLSKSTPYAYCQTNGNWFITNDNSDSNICMCMPGYYYSSSDIKCIECPIGKYKNDASNQLECTTCPANSWSSSIASKYCTCLEGFYRINSTDLNSSCIQYPPEPKNLTVYYLDQATIKLRWDQIDMYEKNMVQYKLECYKCKDNFFIMDETNGKTSRNVSQTQAQGQGQAGPLRRNSMCSEKFKCENYVRISPKKDEIFENKVTLSSLDSNTQYLIELYAQHVQGLFKTKTVDIMVRTSQDIDELAIVNITAYQFTDMNQIMVMWSDPLSVPSLSSTLATTATKPVWLSTTSSGEFRLNKPRTNTFISYELRYWPKDEFDKANIIIIKAPAQNFTLKNSNPNVISTNIYVFQIRGQSLLNGWGPYSQPIESIKIANVFLTNKNNLSTLEPIAFAAQESSSTIEQILPFKQIKSSPSSSSSSSSSSTMINKNENLTAVAIGITSSLCFIIVALTVLVILTRTGRAKCLSRQLSKPVTGSSGSNSDCDSIDFAKRNAQMAYNQFGTCSAGTTSSGGSSPMWPPLNGCKTYIDPHTYEDPTKVVSLFARELSPTNIKIESVIGGGEFGDVCKGSLKLAPWSEVVVAIKTLKGAATEQNRCDFLTEASIMAQFNDPNVIRLEGVVTQSHPLMIVTEYMENGSLDTFLRLNETKLKLPQLVRMLKDVSSGMRYLSDMNYIHRDLAARNILVNKDLVCKVADFGLSREIDNEALEYTTKGGKIPIRWTAPEACNFRKYSHASDVWSFGILAWEILSFGERPYWNWENTDVIKANKELYRLPPPHSCPDCLYKLILRCWQEDRTLRPKFTEIVVILDEILRHPEELRKPTKIRELLPINPRAPTQIQLTSTKQFLSRLSLEQYTESFERVGLANLSNLFQLEAKDLTYSLNILSQYDQKKILDELNRISENFHQSVLASHQTSYNSSLSFNDELFAPSSLSSSSSNSNQINKLTNNNNTINLIPSISQQQQLCLQQQHQQQHQQQRQQTSIFQLIRTNSINNSKIINTVNNNNINSANSNLNLIKSNVNQNVKTNDLLIFSATPITTTTTTTGNQNINNKNTTTTTLSHGFLV